MRPERLTDGGRRAVRKCEKLSVTFKAARLRKTFTLPSSQCEKLTESVMPDTEVFTLLDNKSSTQQNHKPKSYREHLLRFSEEEMRAVELLFEALNLDFTVERLRSCRTSGFFMREISTGTVRVSAKSCHVRFCPLCSAARSATIRTNTKEWLKNQKFPKFLTLTLRHCDDSLKNQLDNLYNSFRELRRLKLFKGKVTGGIWFFEVKKGKDGKWHPHLHCCISGQYISQKHLSREWLRLTGSSPIVDIRLVKDVEAVADYVAKYAVKPCLLKNFDEFDRIELFNSLKKRRLCGTWGTAKKFRLTAKPHFEKSQWENIGSWRTVVELINHDENARLIWQAWNLNKPLEAGISTILIDKFITGIPDPPLEEAVKNIEPDTLLF